MLLERLAADEEHQEQLRRDIELLSAFPDYDYDEAPISLKRGEVPISVASGGCLVESRRGATRYRGASHGLSIRVAKGIYYRPGMHGGEIRQDSPDAQKIVDVDGDLILTNQRAVFTGTSHMREWRWDKLVRVDITSINGNFAVLLPVENRMRVSGVITGMEPETKSVERIIKFAMAVKRDASDAFLGVLREELAALDEEDAGIMAELSALERSDV